MTAPRLAPLLVLAALTAAGGSALADDLPSDLSPNVQRQIRLERSARAQAEHQKAKGTAGEVVILLIVAAGVIIVVTTVHGRLSTPEPSPMAATPIAHRGNQREQERLAALTDLQARDPEFREELFLREARTAFGQILESWSLRRLEESAHLMSDGVLRRFLVELELNAQRGVRNVLLPAGFFAGSLIAVETDEAYDTLHVSFGGQFQEREVPAGTADEEAVATARASLPRAFEEVWSFVRRREHGQAAGQLTAGKCPSCGAPIARSAVATCEHCQAILNSGAHDWVLAEITEAGDFFCRPSKHVRNWQQQLDHDPLINRQVLEDRASLIFWKWIEARATGSTGHFARLCTPEALERLDSCSDAPPRGFRRVVLGDVQLLEVEPEQGRAHLQLYWRTAAEDWELPRKSMLTLRRDPALTTRADTGMATDRCHRCAGFQRELEAVHCEWCGALLPADWSFVNVLPLDEFYEVRHEVEGRAEALADFAAPEAVPGQGAALVASMVAMARADGHVLESERKLVEACARRLQVPTKNVQRFWEMPLEVLQGARPRTAAGRLALLRGLVAAATADHAVSRPERAVLSNLATHYGVDLEEIVALLDEASEAASSARSG